MLQWHISVTMLLFYSQLFLHHEVKSLPLKVACSTFKNSATRIGLFLKCMEIIKAGYLKK